ncbi:MAG: hypothetical protein AABX34_03025, partial [Nanoarchaeota archaeon]
TNSLSHSNSQSFSSDASGTYYVRCNDTIGNFMNSSNSTAFNANVQESSSGGASGGGSAGNGGSGNSGWSCRYKVECTAWSECFNGEQTRSCENVAVVPFYSSAKCEYLEEQETERECIEPPTCSDNIKNQDEDGIDCGGPCGPCFSIGIGKEEVEELPEETSEPGLPAVTGRFILSDIINNTKPYYAIIAGLILAVIGVSAYFRYFRKRPVELKEEEMKRLRKILPENTDMSKEKDKSD